MQPAETRYIDRGDAILAYQVIGTGSHEILVNYEINGHLDLMWTDPHMHATYEWIAPRARMVVMQRRGVGLSESVSACPTVEQQADDISAVMRTVGFTQTTLLGLLSTCAPIALVVAQDPQRVRGLVLAFPYACGVAAERATECGWPHDAISRLHSLMMDMVTKWGSGRSIELWDRELATPYNMRLMGLMERAAATPMTARSHYEFLVNHDATQIFSAVGVPTRIVYPPNGIGPDSVVRHVGGLIAGSEVSPLPPTPRGAAIGEAFRPIFGTLVELASGEAQPADPDRRMATVLFTDIVGSTDLLGRIGDGQYSILRDQHERDVRLAIESSGGRLISVSGDGTLSLFHRAIDAVSCADLICREATRHGIAVRAGIHTGEVVPSGMDVQGMTVHIGARIAALAGAGEVFISRQVKELLLGSTYCAVFHGTHRLKGVPGQHDVYVMTRQDQVVPQELEDRVVLNAADRLSLQLAKRMPRLVRGGLVVGNRLQRLRHH